MVANELLGDFTLEMCRHLDKIKKIVSALSGENEQKTMLMILIDDYRIMAYKHGRKSKNET